MSVGTITVRRRTVRTLATGVSAALVLAGAVVLASPGRAEAAVVKGFTQDYSAQVYGDFLEVGNANLACPTNTTVDPTRNLGGTNNTVANCTTAQQRGATPFGNDSFRMIQANPAAGVLNSSQATLTIPPGATVAFARLNWSANTGVLENRQATGQVGYVSCGGGNTAQRPAVAPTGFGSYATNPVTLVANGQTGAYPAGSSLQVDPTASLLAGSPQYYSAFADVTAQLAGATTGTAIPVTVQNVWGPSGFNCYAGWSLTVVYSYPAPNPTYAPLKRQVYVYNGHVRQQATDAPTSIDIPDLRLATSNAHIGVTAYEGDDNISGDQLLVNGTAIADPLTATDATPTTNNFFVGNAVGDGSWSNGTAGGTFTPGPPNVFSVDAKTFETDAIVPQGTAPSTADLTFQTSGDSYLAQEVVVSAPLPEIRVSKQATTSVARAGGTASFTITVANPTPSPLTGVVVTDAQVPGCDNAAIGDLAGLATTSYACSGTVPDNGSTSFVNAVTATGDDYTGTPVTGSGSSDPVSVIHPAISVTKTADHALYVRGATVTYTIAVTDTGDAALTDTAVSDGTAPDCGRTLGSLTPGQTTTYTCTTTAPVVGASNTALAVGTDPTGQTVSASANAPSPTAGSVTGTVFADLGSNGALDGSDTGIPGVTLTLLSAGGTSTTASTASNGGFSFTGVAPGTYTLTETQPAGYADGTDTPGSGAVRSAQDVFTVTVPDAGTSAGNLFGEVPSDSLRGRVYVDANDDGVRQPSEDPIPGVGIDLGGHDDAGNAVSLSTQTGADGTYAFAALRPGTYTITELQPAGYVQGSDAAGTPAGSTAQQDVVADIPLTGTSTAGTGYDFGELTAASLSGQVSTAAGTPLSGVALTVTGTDDRGAAVSVPATTDGSGAWIVTGLRPGTYAVTETQPPAYGPGSAVAGTVDGTPSGTANGTHAVDGIVLGNGATGTGYSFVATASSLTGTVFSDADGDGVQGPPAVEPGLGGAVVSLTGTGADGRVVSQSVTTDPDGSFAFHDLPAGTGYTLVETQPTAYLSGIVRTGTGGGSVSGDTVSGITVTAGSGATGYTFGEVAPASVGGIVTDQAGNPVVGATVTLGGAASRTTTTATDGSYGFTSLRPGTYSVTETTPAGLGTGTDAVGTVNGTTVGATAGADAITGIVLPAGGIGADYDFTDVAGTLAGSVYVDADGDGQRDHGEGPIANVTVTLTGPAGTRTTTTGTDGSYSFGGLVSGTYALTETQPPGYVEGSAHVGTGAGGAGAGTAQSPDAITGIGVGIGGAGVAYDFGELQAASLAGTVTADTGAPIPHVTVTLTAPGGATTATTTAADGSWGFTGLVPGTYAVTETQPAGYDDPATGGATAGTAGGLAATDTITGIALGSDAAATGYAFVDSTATLSGSVYVDADGDGTRDHGEGGVAGTLLTLTGGPDHVTQTFTTPAGGAFSFPGLVAGTYTLTEAQPPQYAQGTDVVGSGGGTVSQTATTDTVAAVAVPTAGAPGYLFGELPYASIEGSVTAGPTGEDGTTVTLTSATDPTFHRSITTTGGLFSFTSVPPGTYVLTETQPAAFAEGDAHPGTVGGTVDGTRDDPNTIGGVVLGPGAAGTGYGFTDTGASISGTVFDDGDDDGVQQVGEPGIDGVALTLTGPGGTIPLVTAGGGAFSATGLPAGTYTLTETQPAGYTSGITTAGGGDGTVTGDTVGAITVAAGSVHPGYTFGEYTAGSVSGTVLDDQGRPVAGVTVTATDAAGGTTPTTTDDHGRWSLPLDPGTYSLTETQPAGYGPGTAAAGTPGGGTPVTTGPGAGNVITGVTVRSGTPDGGYAFVDATASVSGTVFEDVDGNGARGLTEPGVSGVLVQVLDGTTVVGSFTTGADGRFTVAGLLSTVGYTVLETQPPGYVSGRDTAGTAGGTAQPDGVTVTGVTLAAGAAADGYLFGEYRPSTVGGRVVDQDGRPLGGVVVSVVDPVTSAVLGSDTTHDDGTWSVGGLPPGSYSLVQTQPTAYGELRPVVGTGLGGAPSGTDTVTGLTVGSGSTGTGYGFVDVTSSISGSVFVDTDGDGVQDHGETGLTGQTVSLVGGPTAVPPTTTHADGSFSFAGLAAGTYTVVETQPAAYVSGKDTVGTVGGVAVGTDDGNGTSFSAVALPAGSPAVGYTFAEYVLGSISGSVVDSTGKPLPGVPVTVSGGGLSVPVTVNTGLTGTYTSPLLPPGSYTVTEQQPPAYGVGTATPGTDLGTATDGNTVTGVTVASGSAGAGTGPAFVDVAASLAGVVFLDHDGDGVQGTGEAGLGQAVPLTLTDDDTFATYLLSADPTTGAFSVGGLPAGTYTLTETQPTGYASGTDSAGSPAGGTAASDGTTISGIVVQPGSTNTGYRYPEFVLSPVTGVVKTDTNAPIAGVTITATGPNGPLPPVQTDDQGFWTLVLPPGSYTISESQPAGYGEGTAAAGTGVGGAATGPDTIGGVTVTSGSSGVDYTFVDTTDGLSGVVYADVDGDGVQGPGEPGIPNVTITVRNASGTVVRTTSTVAGGTWTIGGLPAGTYSVIESQPSGYGDGTADAGTTNGVTNGTPAADGNSITGVVLTAGSPNGDGYDFGDTTGSVSGLVYEDTNGNGIADLGEPGIPNTTITVLQGTKVVGTTTSGADGRWTVSALPAGQFTVTETQPPGYADGADQPGTGGGTPVAPDSFVGVTVRPGEDESGYTFGEVRGAITGTVFLDHDRDGVYTVGIDRPEGGVTVTLLDADGAAVNTQVTAPDGSYGFSRLAPGSYTLVEQQPAGYGSDTPDRVAVTLTTGTTVDFGDQGATIGDTVWRDTNRSGVRDPGEPGVGGIPLTLHGGSGATIATTVSATDGSYAFTDLPAGTYTVSAGVPSGQVLTTAGKATTGQTGSAFDPTSRTTAPIVITVSDAGVIADDLAADAGLAARYGDLGVVASGPTGPVPVGSPVTGTITVTNPGNVPQPGATVTITVPAGQAPTTVGGSTYTCTATPTTPAGVVTITCTTTTPIAPGASAPPITLVTVPTAVGAPPVTVTVRPVAGGTDAAAANDATTVPVTVVAAAVVAPRVTGDGTGFTGRLPFTGLDARGLVGLALLSMASGLVLLLAGRRRDRSGRPGRRGRPGRLDRRQAAAAV